MKRTFGRIAAALLLGLAASAASAQTIAITGGKLALGDGSEPIEGGTVLIRDGRVVAAGGNVAVPPGAETIDAGGKWVTPGLVAGLSRVGIVEVDAVDATNDVQANGSPFSAAIDVVPAVNPRAAAIAISRSAGITRALVAPGTARSIFAGQGAVIDLGADMEPITRARAFQFVELGETGAGEAGGSRAAAYVLFRNALREARDLNRFSGIPVGRGTTRTARANDQRDFPLEEVPDARLLGSAVERSDDVLLTRFDAAALVPVLNGQQFLLVHVERASDILQVLALKQEFPSLRLVLVGATEGWTVADRIAAAGVPVIANALNDLPSTFEQLAATQSNVARMQSAGVKVSLGMINNDESRQLRLSTQNAGNLVALGRIPGASGISWGQALAMISSRPAEAIGLGGEIGSLREGRRGDVVIWDGDPLENGSAPLLVLIDGVRQPLDNRQTRLRDRYRTATEGQLPKAYER
ncbi:amidohydrolase family protein [Sphingosinicella rhizophila]|uniref:Amidohydrolase family protein n=1 Tax=Sphingosinicella rhizophila TaxID=3050082 RepID=A0ABU3Q4D6_9SPHN|nr:amidohydrolase family protein [Sphingosinicella sp. GR2756]MDT9598281.1 amidohydrolase family protein [Sphingosinicella sp. GR2756]